MYDLVVSQDTYDLSVSGDQYDLALETSINVTGGGGPSLQEKSIDPLESVQRVEPDEGYDGLSAVSISAVSSSYVGSGIARRSSSDLTASGATVTVPSGYYSEQASKAVATGTAGTPTAAKGTVSNHSISVTPSVTNVTGYITGSTKTGTAVTVSASELVSGNKEINENGTNIDVTNFSTVSVAVPSSGGVHIDTKTISNSAATNTSISFSSLLGEPKAFFLRCTSTLTRSSSYRYYYVATMRYNGTATTGNRWYMYNGQFSNITSGYSFTWNASTSTLTVSSSGAQSTSPGAFYNGNYELVYIY